MSTHLPPGNILLRSQLQQQHPIIAGNSSQPPTLHTSIGQPKASYNDFIKDIYNGIKSINNSINQITNSVIRMEQRLDTLETGLTTVTTKLTEIQEHISAHTEQIAKQGVSDESMLLTRLDLMDVGCLLEPSLNTPELSTADNNLEQNKKEPIGLDGLNSITEMEKTIEEFDTLILD